MMHSSVEYFYQSPVFIMLAGLPGTGKTTWIKDFLKVSNVPFDVVSTDDIIERVAKENGLTYSDVFQTEYKNAEKESWDIAVSAIANNRNIVWDQTNLTKYSRQKKLALVPSNYTKVGIYFYIPNDWEDRLKNREITGKIIPKKAIENMMISSQIPSIEEGFDAVLTHVSDEKKLVTVNSQ